MNIFVLDQDRHISAQYHCDQHIDKMPLESAQMVAAALYLNKIPSGMTTKAGSPYQITHKHHPCVVWASKSFENLTWLFRFGVILCEEFEHRRGHSHDCGRALLESHRAIDLMPRLGFTDPPKCMDDRYKAGSVVEAYRRYYNAEKLVFKKKGPATWSNRHRPSWINSFSAAVS